MMRQNAAMVRPTQLLHPQREPAAARARRPPCCCCATAPRRLEVLMTRRSTTASFAPGAYVFPGGGIDAADARPHAHRRAPRRPGRPAPDAGHRRHPRKLRGTRRAAGAPCRRHARPTHARHRRARPPRAVRRAVRARAAWRWPPTRSSCWRTGSPTATCRAASTCPSWWRACREGQPPVADEAEQFEPVWVRPADALARHEAGSFFMIFPTIRTLERLQKFDTVDAVLPACAQRAAAVDQLPARRLAATAPKRATWSTRSPYGELALVSPDGQMVHHLDWRTDAAGAAAEERDAAHRAQPRRDDRPRHQQLPGRRPAHRLHRDRSGPGRCRAPASASGAPPAATSA